jgi:lipoate-protein ligase A
MHLLDLTLETPAANLACDEALLDFCEAGGCAEGLLRFWESPEYFVVLGYANRAASEVHLDTCRARAIPVLRRCSGGGTVVQGPGCLNYAVILPVHGGLESITATNCHILKRHRDALHRLANRVVEIRGQTDLAVDEMKFSGNSQRRRRNFLLFHGSFLLDFDLAMIGVLLKFPSKQPDYRRDRAHARFLTNLKIPAQSVKNALRNEWQANTRLSTIPEREIDALVQSRYSRDEWNFRW